MMRKDEREKQTRKHFRLSWAETARSHHMNIFKLFSSLKNSHQLYNSFKKTREANKL